MALVLHLYGQRSQARKLTDLKGLTHHHIYHVLRNNFGTFYRIK